MADILATLGGSRRTPQTQPARADQVQNNAGGFVFQLDDEARLRRFLILGVDGGTYYADARDHALDNIAVVDRMVGDETAGLAAVRIATEVSVAGRARKNQPALFVLAAAAASPHLAVRRAAFDALPQVARTGTHLMIFNTYADKHRGWGRARRRAVGGWYLGLAPDRLALQLVKYRQRGGWTHRDLLRLSHPKPNPMVKGAPATASAFAWVAGKADADTIDVYPELRAISGYLAAVSFGDKLTPKHAAELVTDFRLPWEALPSHVLGSPEVWEALLPHMGITALIRNLPTMTRAGLLDQRGDATREVIRRLGDADGLKRGRVHPLSLLVAARTYAAGVSARGSSTWTPVQRIVDALDEAFYLSFDAVEPTGKRMYLALDVSGSMGWDTLCDAPGITPRVASAALALVTANVESDYEIHGFSSRLVDVPISPRMRLDQALDVIDRIPMGGTDCAAPFVDAAARRADVDVFVTYTDNETWAGSAHPHQALRDYRHRAGIPARSMVVGMTATRFTIADPTDPGQLDIAGFDTATPELISSFARGDF